MKLISYNIPNVPACNNKFVDYYVHRLLTRCSAALADVEFNAEFNAEKSCMRQNCLFFTSFSISDRLKHARTHIIFLSSPAERAVIESLEAKFL